ncbi:MAG: sodium-dependent bicarbonate transport family permease [Pseudomonadota bacterium]
MDSIFTLAANNILSPMVLAFGLGFAASLARSDLSVPEAAAKALSLYLLFAIGFKGGVSVAESGLSGQLIAALLVGIILSAIIPFIAYALLRSLTKLSVIDAAAVAAHYGSISVVTFVAASSALDAVGLSYEGYMVAVAAAMEAPAILSALWLIGTRAPGAVRAQGGLMREILLNGSIVLLVGSFAIGWITGPEGLKEIEAFVIAPFKGVLCLFLLDMGLVAGRGFREARGVLQPGLVGFGLVMPLLGAVLGGLAGLAIGLSPGGIALLVTLSASASYIAVPAAMRVALPQANPSIYLTLSLGVTFPFNLTLGIPAYIALGVWLGGGA